MVTVTAETSLSSSLDDAWLALGRRATYFYFPGLAPAAGDASGKARGALCHQLDLPIVDRQEQSAVLTVARAGKAGRRERRFTVRGELVTITGRWRLEPGPAGVRAHLTLDYDVAPPLLTLAVNTLRSRSPLPIRTDADAIIGRAVGEFFETRFAEHAARFCERVRGQLDGNPGA
ncbi:MAG TPA: hypothetical protein VEH80_10910 [Candidatus Bathyarchaeia archaeon]|nr:hypothetical protein [Candidatus Bathyarchaeia archaeon]